MTLRKSLLIPLAVFLVMVVFLALGFQLRDPHLLPSVLIDKPFPEFTLDDLADSNRKRTREDVVGRISLVNVWGTWCPNCVIEHPELMRISREEDIPLIGVNYNDDVVKARAWLKRRDDPYEFRLRQQQPQAKQQAATSAVSAGGSGLWYATAKTVQTS